MRAVFRPGFTIVDYLYDNPSSGGEFIVTPGTPGVPYLDPVTGRIYLYMEGEGWYYIDDTGTPVYDPTQDGSGLVPAEEP